MHDYIMALMWLVLILFIIALLYYSDMESDDDVVAKKMLDNRFAKGEINFREYRVIKESLRL